MRFTFFSQKTMGYTLTFAGLGAIAYLDHKLEQKQLTDFKLKYPGETPKRTWHPVTGVEGYWTYERDVAKTSSLKR